MNSILLNDLSDIENILEKAKQQSISFLNNLENVPTSNNQSIDFNRELNKLGLGSLGALEEFNKRLAPLMVASPGPMGICNWRINTGFDSR